MSESIIKRLRMSKGLTQEQLGKLLGVTKQTVNKYEQGKVQTMKRTTIEKLAEIFDVDPLVFMRPAEEAVKHSVASANPFIVPVPVYTKISCGTGLWVDEEPFDYVGIPSTFARNGVSYFCNQADGDSMLPRIKPNDYLIFERSETIDNGQIGSFSLNKEYYCKRFKRYPDGSTWLISENSDYPPIPVTQNDDFRVLGVYKFKFSKEQ